MARGASPVEGGGGSGGSGSGNGASQLVAAALRVVPAVGADKLTMRLVGEELGVTPMAAYHYVRGKEELLELCVEAAVAEGLARSEPANGAGPRTWDEELRVRAHATFHALATYPGLGAFALERPLSPVSRQGHQRGVALLVEAGLSERDAEMAYASFHTYMFGLVGMEARFRQLKRGRARKSDDAILVDAGVDEFIDFGIDLLIAGIRTHFPTTVGDHRP